MKPLFLLYIAIFIGAIGQLLLKFGLNKIGGLTLSRTNFIRLIFTLFLNPYIVWGVFLYGISAFLWLIGLSNTPLSIAYPLISLSYIVVVLFSWILFYEKITLLKILGLFIICFGVFLLGKSK